MTPEEAAWEDEKRRQRAAATHAPAAPSAPLVRGPAPIAPPSLSLDAPLVPVPKPAAPPAPTPIDPLSPLQSAVEGGSQGQPAAALEAARAMGPDVSKTSNWNKSETQTVQTDREKALTGRLEQSFDKEIGVAERAKDVAVAKAGADASLADEEVSLFEAKEAAGREERDKAEEAYKSETAVLKQRQEAASKRDLTSYWADKSTGAKILAALSIGIGQFGASLRGQGENTALRIIEGAMENHRKLQLDQIAQSKELAQMQAQNVGLAREYMEGVDRRVKADLAGVADGIGRRRRALLARYGVDEAAIESDRIVVSMAQKRDAILLENEKTLRKQISRTSGGQQTTSNASQNDQIAKLATKVAAGPDKTHREATDGEKTNDNFMQKSFGAYQQLKEYPGYTDKELKIIEEEERRIDDRLAKTAPGEVAAMFTALRGTASQRLRAERPEAAGRWDTETEFVTSTVRPESGAQIGAQELQDAARGIRAGRNDPPEELARKNNRALSRMGGLAIRTFRPGEWYGRLRESTGGQPGAGATTAPGAPAAMTREQIAGALVWARQNPRDPRAREIEATAAAAAAAANSGGRR